MDQLRGTDPLRLSKSRQSRIGADKSCPDVVWITAGNGRREGEGTGLDGLGLRGDRAGCQPITTRI